MTDPRPRLLTLDEAAQRSGRPVELLREWCATGRIECEHLGGRWLVPESSLEAIRSMPTPSLPFEAAGSDGTDRSDGADRTDADGGDRIVAIAFRDRGTALRAARELAARLGLGRGDLSVGPLALDGLDLFVVAGRLPRAHGTEIEAIVRHNSGTVVAAGRVRRGGRSGASARPSLGGSIEGSVANRR